MDTKKTLVVVVGPTAIGKTALAIQLANFYATEIVSADSRQFYREMSIGTAKPSNEELAAAPHHFINSHSITELFSTGDFEVSALALMERLFLTKDILIMVGGSGLYIDSVTRGLDDLPATDLEIRAQLNQELADFGLEGIREKLRVCDPEYYQKVDQSNPQRIIRGLEFFLSTGKKLSSFQTNTKKSRPFNIVKIGLDMDRNKLYERINKRVDLMISAGLLEEVRNLVHHRGYNALNTVGYTELFDYLDHQMSFEDAVEKIKQNTRRFAKRQLTWFRKDQEIIWFNPHQTDLIIDTLNTRLR
ncbi:tRNA (adenosine(37)-N6)-dimethylallyltransferase MiaA [Pedobacter faecalis]|uniref:tRNA (adenosine(37)-N6)-dimethylallyltransferase MiaA n=1 Tax=Pedobacter faecalis TaxID=3041495 RepID=UPI00254B348C|nr:tRNA (adenosine(37)-N6)-dimethylallyltransferase MiaA [Pedobacter sp. ELA7]